MATKENQGLQASIIVLAILVIGLGVGLLLVNNAKKTAIARADESQRQAGVERDAHAKAQAEISNYKEWMGFAAADAAETLQNFFDEDKTRLMASLPEESRNYRAALDSISEENRKASANEAKAKQDVKDITDRLLAVEARKEAQVKEAQKQLAVAAADAATEKAKFQKFRTAIQAEKEKIAADFAALQTVHAETVAKLDAEKTTLETNIAKLERSIDKLREGLPEVDQFAQPADGEISWVNQAHGKVWIDLGSADGLRPQVTFSVAAEGDADAEAAEKKGTIEVLQIRDAHMAEARITSDDPTNPLMPGDRIYSQVWDRGRQVGFAIAGVIDLDDDRKSDLQQLKGIITSSNGRLDAAPDEEGKLQGELKVDTRYLVLGTYPNGTTAEDEALRTSWETASTQAEELGIETVPLEEFVKLMGWQTNNRSVRLDSGSRAEDFPAEARGQDMPRKTRQPAGVFKKRLPGVNY